VAYRHARFQRHPTEAVEGGEGGRPLPVYGLANRGWAWRVPGEARGGRPKTLGKFATMCGHGRAFRRWMNRIGRLWRQGWPDDQKVQLGAALIQYMVECGGGEYFTLPIVWYSGKKHKLVALTEKACALIEDEHARREIMQPLRRPAARTAATISFSFRDQAPSSCRPSIHGSAATSRATSVISGRASSGRGMPRLGRQLARGRAAGR
jgi:hypothetical protein